MNPSANDFTPLFKSEVVKMVKFIHKGDLDIFNAYWTAKDALRDACSRVARGSKDLLMVVMQSRCEGLLEGLCDIAGKEFVRWSLNERCRECGVGLAIPAKSDVSSGSSGAVSCDGSVGVSLDYYPTTGLLRK